MSEGFFLRTITSEDADAVARIGYQAWVEHRFHPEWFEPEIERRVLESFHNFALGPQADVVVCQLAGKIAGWGARDSRDHGGDRSHPWNYISDLWISPPWQGKGIGSAIIDELLSRMRAEAIEKATIEVVEANHKAHRLYLHRGFAEIWRGDTFSETLGLPVRRILLERAVG
ncbi:GNAT family N-acetyltransferase [Rhizobium sp. LjRoot30]|uniref:GNAT family N-acetyltransferase n=1 Tax=Rhizobium sp. LjRoot30 TaxID=3342320 RepID=UPI003ED14887